MRTASPVQRLVVGSKWGYRYVGEFRMDAAVHEVKEHSVSMLDEQWPQTLEALGDRIGEQFAALAVERLIAELELRGGQSIALLDDP